MRLRLKLVLASTIVVLALGLNALPAAAATSWWVGSTYFALWPGPFCGLGDGLIDSDGYISSSTASQKDAGSPACPHISPGAYNAFAAQPKLYQYYQGNTFYCESWYSEVNVANTWIVVSGHYMDGCGDGAYKLKAEWRITYGGTPQYGSGWSPIAVIAF